MKHLSLKNLILTIRSFPCDDVKWDETSRNPILRSKHKRVRDSTRYLNWLLRKAQLKMALEKAYWDKDAGELVSFEDYPDIEVVRGEVFLDKRGYISPSILWLQK
jgi:hypothetical protein